ncbi:MAG: mRNA surveillance protein pelota [Candidatus Thermoplasmatota archaeon]
MKIVYQDKEREEIKVVPENLDDIWHLYNVIEEDDLVRMVTFRTEEQRDDMQRAKKPSKKKMKLGLRVEDVEFHKFSDRLRVQGVIEEGPQEHGSHHTFNVEAEKMTPITIIKDDWKDHQLDRLKEAVRQSKQALLTFVSLDDETATIAVLRQSGVEKIADIDSKKSGKMYDTDSYNEKEYFGEIITVVENNKKPGGTLVILGPGFVKDRFVKFGKEKHPEIFDNYVVHNAGQAGMNGVMEAIKSGVVKQITKENRVVYETELVEKLFREIKKNGLASYGMEKVEYALKNGAVEHLLLTDELTRTSEGEKLLQIAKENKSQFTIINTMHEAGEKLQGLGGVGAILRFKI